MSKESVSAHRLVALGVLLTGVVTWVALAWWLVPWHPVPGGIPEPVPAESVFSSEELARASEYATPVRHLAWASLALSVVVSVALGLSRCLRARTTAIQGPWWWQSLVTVAGVQCVVWLVTLPFMLLIWQRRVDFGLSSQSLSGVLRDQTTTWGIQTLVLCLVVLALIGSARRWRNWWPVIAGAALVAAVLAGSWLYPVTVEPLFNDFTSLPQGALRSEVMALAEAEGVQVSDVLVADASRRTTSLNAYVSGFGNSRRVVLYDTLVDSSPQEEALAVVAHELAHAKHQDVLLGTVLGALGVLTGVGALGVAVGRRLFASAGSVPALLAVFAVASVLVAPIQNGISRVIETRADVVALQVTKNPDAVEKSQRQFALRALTDPLAPEWSQWWFGSHPTVRERIAIAWQVSESP